MNTIKATIKGRRLELDVPADWPDGIEVEIYPVVDGKNPEEEQISAEEIARTLEAMDRVEPFKLTEAEMTAWETERQARKERDKAEFAENANKLRRDWE